MFSSNACHFFLFFLVSLSANAETVRGVHRGLEAAVDLNTAGDYAILAQTGISTVPASVITGNIAVSPIASTAMTGFSFTLGSEGQLSKSTQVAGEYQAYSPNYSEAVATALTAAVLDMGVAYNYAANRDNNDASRINLLGGILTAVTLSPGVYTFTTGVHLTGDIYFDGSADDVFIIQIAGNLLADSTTNVILTGGALAKNIFWQVAGNVKVRAGATMKGILLVKTDVTFITGSTLNGRVLAQTACVLQKATITD